MIENLLNQHDPITVLGVMILSIVVIAYGIVR